jgi:hypothetical protein
LYDQSNGKLIFTEWFSTISHWMIWHPLCFGAQSDLGIILCFAFLSLGSEVTLHQYWR